MLGARTTPRVVAARAVAVVAARAAVVVAAAGRCQSIRLENLLHSPAECRYALDALGKVFRTQCGAEVPTLRSKA
jgi:hypothetical protein